MAGYVHPDPVCIALAQGSADASGHPPGHPQWHRAYRAAYLEQNQDENGVRAYLERYDRAMVLMQTRSDRLGWRMFYAIRRMIFGPEKLL